MWFTHNDRIRPLMNGEPGDTSRSPGARGPRGR